MWTLSFLTPSILILFPTIILSTRVQSLADQRCPCKEATQCDVRFAEMNPAAQDAVLRFIPSCPSFQGRCCTTEAMLVTIIALSQRQAPNPALPTPVLLSPRQENSPVTCVPVDQCPVGNIYGTDAAHFDLYGFISPEELNCLTSDENILCIQQENTQDTALPAEELPCVQPSACSEVYGVEESHFDDYGLQFACQTSTDVRCVAEVTLTATTTTTQQTTTGRLTTRRTASTTTTTDLVSEPEMLPCLHPSLCLEEYGTLLSHFTTHGLQFQCPAGYVRCVSSDIFPLKITTGQAETILTTSRRPPTTTRPATTRRTSINPLFTTQAPLTPPTPAVVNIIGPSPIYIAFNENHGPSFTHKSESLSIKAGDKNQQIRNLLELLDERLRHVLKKYPKQH